MTMTEITEKYKKDLDKLKIFEIINYSIAAIGVITWIIMYFCNINIILLVDIFVIVLIVDMIAVNLAYIKPQKKKIIEEGHNEIVKMIVNEKFPNCVYNPEMNLKDGITSADIRSTGLFSKWTNAFNTKYNIKSIYKGVPFRFCSVESYDYDKYTIKSEGYADPYDYREIDVKNVAFKGCWFIFNCHIKLSSSIIIVSKHTKIEEELMYKQKISPLCQIATPNNDFNRLFSVFSYDIESPQKLLTEKLMNNLFYFENKIRSAIYVYIDNGIVHVGVEHREGFFKPMLSIFDSVEKMIQSLYYDMNFIFDCLNTFDFSEYVTKAYTDFKLENDSIFYTGKDVDTNYYI